MEKNLQPNIEHTINTSVRAEVVAAANAHITAKNLSEQGVGVENLRTEDTMSRLVRLAETRDGLAAIIAMQQG
jgi:hypothetical protein